LRIVEGYVFYPSTAKDSLFERFNHLGVGYMAKEDNFHVGKPPVFDGNNYDYWKKRMEVHFKALGRDLSRIVMEGYVILDPKKKMDDDDKNEKFNDRALSVLYNALAFSKFNRVKGLEKANKIWEKIM
jgi:hypothetical protein